MLQDQVSYMLPVFEDFLDKAPNTSSYDTVRQSVIILMGCLARHLDKTDPKVKPIVYKLIDALSTPSQQVCLAHTFPTKLNAHCYLMICFSFSGSRSRKQLFAAFGSSRQGRSSRYRAETAYFAP